MILPLRTDRPLRRPAAVTYTIIAANVLIGIAMAAANAQAPEGAEGILRRLWLDPGDIRVPSLLTYAFLHGGSMHLVFNMLALWVFGPPVEDRFGRIGFTALYLAGAAGAGLLHAVFESAPVIGASGAVAAVTGAFLVLMPRTQVRCLFLLFLSPIDVPAWWLIAAAIARDMLLAGSSYADGVAHAAHLGGYALGAGVSFALLGARVLEREPYDLFSMVRQFQRRSALRDAVRAGERERELALDPARTDPRSGALAAARAEVSARLGRKELAGAAEAYRALVASFPDAGAGGTMPRRHQLDVANQLAAEGRHRDAADAYGRFLEAYPRDGEAPRVRLLLAVLCARYLGDAARARELLASLRGTLGGAEAALAGELEREVGGVTAG